MRVDWMPGVIVGVLFVNRILKCQEELSKLRRVVEREGGRVRKCRQVERMFLEKRDEKEGIISRLKLLRTQLQEIEAPVNKGIES